MIEKFIRFLKDKKCNKKFFKYFYSTKSQTWRKKLGYCCDCTNFKEWFEAIYFNRDTKFRDYFVYECNINFYGLILILSFPWVATDEGRDFWSQLKDEIINELPNEK